MTYGQKIQWTSFNGDKSAVSVVYHPSAEQAQMYAVLSARRMGWRPPRWYQWWRWSDTRMPKEAIHAADEYQTEKPEIYYQTSPVFTRAKA